MLMSTSTKSATRGRSAVGVAASYTARVGYVGFHLPHPVGFPLCACGRSGAQTVGAEVDNRRHVRPDPDGTACKAASDRSTRIGNGLRGIGARNAESFGR